VELAKVKPQVGKGRNKREGLLRKAHKIFFFKKKDLILDESNEIE
jgi:hypothetical protein